MQLHDERVPNFRANAGIIPALMVIGVGVLFLLNNLNIFNVQELWRYWPVVLIAGGLAKLVDTPHHSGRVQGAVLIGVGALFLARNFGVLHMVWRDFWPLLLIGAGVLMLWNRLYTPAPVPASGEASESVLDVNAIFGGVDRKVTTDDFRGGRVSATFGGVELNFRKAAIRGDSAVLDISAMFGGVEIKIPETWIVVLQGNSIFGGFADESVHPPVSMPGAKRLYLKGSAVFGGVSVKN